MVSKTIIITLATELCETFTRQQVFGKFIQAYNAAERKSVGLPVSHKD